MKAWFAAGLILAATQPAFAAGGELTLEQAIARAYETHPDLVSAEARLRRARLAVEDLRNQQFSVSAEVNGRVLGSQTGLLRVNATDSLPTYAVAPFAAGSVGLTVPLFTGWKADKALESAGSEETAQVADRDGARVALTLDVIKAFWGLRKAILAMQIQGQAREQAYRAVESARAGVAAGRQTRHDVEQAEAAWYAAQADSNRAIAEVGSARIAFTSLLGGRLDEYGTVGDPPETPPGPGAPLPPEQIAAALDERPEIRAARARVGAAEAAVGAAKGDYWPQLSFNTSYQHGNNLLDQRSGARGLGDFSGQWDALVTARYNLFDLGKTGREVERTAQDLVAARAGLEKAERQARAEIATAQYRAQFATSTATFLAIGKTLARRHYDWVMARKEQGLVLALAVDDARSKLTVAEQQHLDARIDYVLRMAELKAALGQL